MDRTNKNKTRKFYTTGDIARYCEVDPNTVKRWIRHGNLQAFSTPSGHYRIDRDEFIAFIKRQGFTYDPAYFGEDEQRTDVLIIEDDQTEIDLLSYLLSDLYKEIHIDFATDGFDGYMKIRQQSPKLVLLDLRLPGLTGLELLRAIRSRDEMRDTKVVVISAYSDDDGMEALDELMVEDVLSKPVNKKQLREKCDMFLGNAELQ